MGIRLYGRLSHGRKAGAVGRGGGLSARNDPTGWKVDSFAVTA
jgi:hypothetical protein